MKTIMRSSPLFLACIAMAFSIYAADWPTFRGNFARTGYYPDPAGIPSGAPLWKVKLGGPVISSPAVAGSVLYIGARDSCVYAINCNTGAVIWKMKTGGWVDASPLVDGNQVVAGSRDNSIYLLDKNTGNILGILSAGVQLSSPALAADGAILSGLGLPGGGLAGYDRNASLAKKAAAGPQWSIALQQYTYSSPAIRGQAVVIGATDGTMYGIDAGSRKTIWSIPTGGLVYLSTPAIDDTTVYFAPGDDDRSVYAVSLLTGKVFWKNAGFSPSADLLKARAKRMSVSLLPSAETGKLLRMGPSLRKKTIRNLRGRGVELPRLPLAALKGLGKRAAGGGEFISLDGMKTSSIAVGPAGVFVVQKELGYVLTNDSLVDYKQKFTLQAFDKQSGAPLWSFSDLRTGTEHGYCSSPVATKTTVFFGWGEGRIYGLDAKTGEKFWEDSLTGNVLSSPAIAQGRLYAATMDGYVYAYDLAETPPGLDFQRSTYCYPNPARGSAANIQVYAEKSGTVTIALYTLAEKPVLVFSRKLAAGEKYLYPWNLGSVANGVYFAVVKMEYGDGTSAKKILKVAVLK